MITPRACINRIPDHTDFGTCGKATLPGNRYCIECRVAGLARLRRAADAARDAYELAQRAYNELLAEGVPGATLVTHEEAARIGREVKKDFEDAERKTEERGAELDELDALASSMSRKKRWRFNIWTRRS